MTTRYYFLSLLSGCAWAALGYMLAHEVMGKIVWAGVIASPFIGIGVGAIFGPACRYSQLKRFFASLGTLYIAVGLFGLVAGIYDAFRPLPPAVDHRITWAVIVQSILTSWWGITFTGMFVGLWPLSFLNHSLVCRWGQTARCKGASHP